MNHELEVGYLVVEVPEPASLDGFFGDVVGLERGTAPSGTATAWRNDDRAQRIVVEAGARNDATAIGLEAVDAACFERCCERVAAAGYQVTDGSPAAASQRRVAALVEVEAPWGVSVEFVRGLDRGEPFRSARVPGGFLTDGVGFGHVVFATSAWDESQHFVTEALGMEQSDWLSVPIGEGIELEVRFYHCNQRHHSLALAKAPFELPQKLHHLMVEVNDRDDVGAAFDRAWESGQPIPNGLGRHDNDGMFSFYVTSPAGFQVEVGHGARTVTEDWADDRHYDRISLWGHQPLRGA